MVVLLSAAGTPGLVAQRCGGQSGVVGDVTGDGTVDAIDAQRIARFSAGLSVPEPERVEAFGDVNGDGEVDVLDAQAVARHSAGLSTDAPVGEPCNPGLSATITAPEDGATFQEGASITFEGSASDPEDGELTGKSLEWSSDVDGALGTGETVTATLSVAAHRVTLTATDSDGNTADASVQVTVEAAAGFGWQQVSAGEEYTCGVADDGTAYCWGDNFWGQIGDGTTTDRSTPVEVSGGITFTQISTGGLQTCGLAEDGTAYCWGRNDGGSLGDGTTTDRSTPVEVSGGITFTQISAANDDHTCGLAEDGTAYCWGENGDGELGDGTTTDRSSPVQVSGGISWRQVGAGAAEADAGHTCGVADDGTAYCWGSNSSGELGDGSTVPTSTPVQVSGGIDWQQVSGGADHTCGVATDAAAHCWGDNPFGQLGDGTNTDRSTPVRVSGGINWQQISAGTAHTCGVAEDGAAYCWGRSQAGELGDGTTTNRNEPVQVVEP